MFPKISPIILLCFLLTVGTVASAEIFVRKNAQDNVDQPNIENQTKAIPQTNTAPEDNTPSQAAFDNARNVASYCLDGKWETPDCLKAVSQNNLTMAANYSAALNEVGKNGAAEVIKQKCAASTAATREEVPAYAMKSAFLECVNTIPEIANGTGVLPDQSQFQLLVAAIQCLDKAKSCAMIEQGLSAYKP